MRADSWPKRSRLYRGAGEIDAALQRVAGWPLATVLRKIAVERSGAGAARPAGPATGLDGLVALRGNRSGRGRGPRPRRTAAAAAAGILTAEEALRLVMIRGDGGPAGDDLRPRPASLPFLSSMDGRWHAGPDLDAAHWRSCVGRSGDWAAAMAALDDRQVDVCLEIGPASRLESIGHSPASKDLSALSLPSLLPAEQGGVDVLHAIGTLYAAGADPLWDRLAPPDGRCVRVPTYPWQRQRLWTLRKNWSAGLSAAGSEEPFEAVIPPAREKNF